MSKTNFFTVPCDSVLAGFTVLHVEINSELLRETITIHIINDTLCMEFAFASRSLSITECNSHNKRIHQHSLPILNRFFSEEKNGIVLKCLSRPKTVWSITTCIQLVEKKIKKTKQA